MRRDCGSLRGGSRLRINGPGNAICVWEVGEDAAPANLAFFHFHELESVTLARLYIAERKPDAALKILQSSRSQITWRFTLVVTALAVCTAEAVTTNLLRDDELQAGLRGLLNKLWDLNLSLLAVTRLGGYETTRGACAPASATPDSN
jgi:hypothetical protein